MIIANNLASLISSYPRRCRTPAARRHHLAPPARYQTCRRFRTPTAGSPPPGRTSRKRSTYLEPAAAAMARDPLVQYHLGMAYAALNRTDASPGNPGTALELAGDSPLPQLQTARETLAWLVAPAAPTSE